MTDIKPTPKPRAPRKAPDSIPIKQATNGVAKVTRNLVTSVVHPQPGIFETTSVEVNGKTYGFEQYLDARHLKFADPEEMNERVYMNMLASGWEPQPLGGQGSSLSGTVLAPSWHERN